MGMAHPGGTVPAEAGAAHRISIADLKRSLFARRRRWACAVAVLLVIVLGLCCIEIMVGNTAYSPGTIGAVLAGANIEGATYAVWEVRLPRLLAGALVGFAFGIAGNTFQTMLRNPLASPDVIGITSGASVTAVFCILIVGMGASGAAPWAIAGGVATAALIFALSSIGGFSIGKVRACRLGHPGLYESRDFVPAPPGGRVRRSHRTALAQRQPERHHHGGGRRSARDRPPLRARRCSLPGSCACSSLATPPPSCSARAPHSSAEPS